MIENWGAMCLQPSTECSSKGLSAFWRIFWMGNLQVVFLSVLQCPLLSPCQLSKEWLSPPNLWVCLILVTAPISQLLLGDHFEVWSTFSASLVEPMKASEKTGGFAKAYRLWGGPQNHGCPCRKSKLGISDWAVLGSRVIWLGGESRAYHLSLFTCVGFAACLAQVSGSISAVSKWFSLNNPRHYTLALSHPLLISLTPTFACIPARMLNVYWTRWNWEKQKEWCGDAALQ